MPKQINNIQNHAPLKSSILIYDPVPKNENSWFIIKKAFLFRWLNQKKGRPTQTLHLARSIWKKFQLLINPYQGPTVARRGRPRVHLRRVFLGIYHLAWIGYQWRTLPRKYGTRSTVRRYFTEWAQSGLFLKLWKLCLAFMNKRGKIKRDVTYCWWLTSRHSFSSKDYRID